MAADAAAAMSRSAPPGLERKSAVEGFALDVLIAVLATAAAAATRILLEQFIGGIAPFILTFPAVILATLLRGGAAGTMTAVCCQLLTIRYVFPHWLPGRGGLPADLANVSLSTIALALMVWATAAYRASADMLQRRCEEQVHTLSLLIAEMDHRTKNNFQVAANLLALQASSSMDGALARELERAASRLESIASLYQDLGSDLESNDSRDLASYLKRVVELLRSGAVPQHILLSFKGQDIVVSAQTAIIVGLIVNEWVTNALKHAFGDGPGRIEVGMRLIGDTIEVSVSDDGAQVEPVRPDGDGHDLVQSMAAVIAAKATKTVRNGTRCVLRFVPRAARVT